METKKLFALASVSALAGVMTTVVAAGCSSTTTETVSGEGGSDAAKDVVKREAAPEEDAEPEPECPTEVGFDYAAIDKEIGWKPAKAAPGSCKQTDLTTFEKNFESAKTWLDLGQGLEPDCAACLITKDTDENWSIIVATAADDGKTGFTNFGSCFGALEGAECGEALQYANFCLDAACECATTQSAQSKCFKAAGEGPCAEFSGKVQQACPDLEKSLEICTDVIASAKSLCGEGDTDAGIKDGGKKDAN
jgi:hypothetical protein